MSELPAGARSPVPPDDDPSLGATDRELDRIDGSCREFFPDARPRFRVRYAVRCGNVMHLPVPAAVDENDEVVAEVVQG